MGKTEDDFRKLEEENRIMFVTFHPSYSYEDFIEGITIDPHSVNAHYMIKDGSFKRFCARALACSLGAPNWKDFGDKPDSFDAVKDGIPNWKSALSAYEARVKAEGHDKVADLIMKAADDPQKRFLIIIDEINRGDIAKIFGELITLVEPDKRMGGKEDTMAYLLYSSQRFGVPANVFILGTMNTADRSIALMDSALRRRFGFEECYPNKAAFDDLIAAFSADSKSLLFKSVERLKRINDYIRNDRSLGRDKVIGHAYFYQVSDKDDKQAILRIWSTEIFPLLENYYWHEEAKLKLVVAHEPLYIADEMRLDRSDAAILAWLG